MTLDDEMVDDLPDYIPKSSIVVTQSFEYEDPTTRPTRLIYRHDRGYGAELYGSRLYGSNSTLSRRTYKVKKAPFYRVRSVTGLVGGSETTFERGVDYREVDLTGNEQPDGIEFLEAGQAPDTGSEFTIEYVGLSVISRYVGAYDADIDRVSADIDEAIETKSVETAAGDDLDLLGTQYGEIGQRRRRDNNEYRRFLRSVIPAFSGRGTKSDIQFAVAAATGGSPDDVRIEENFDLNGFEVFIDDFTDLTITTALQELVDVASPSGVELLRPPVIEVTTGTATASGSTTDVFTGANLGSSTLGDETLGAETQIY